MNQLFSHHAVVTGFLAAYLVVVLMICFYGFHRYLLVHLFYKYRRNTPQLRACFRERPRVTIQLPMFNERMVARRVIDATCRIDYPGDQLDIQVLDDSTDQTVQIAQEAVKWWQEQGVNIRYIHRQDRGGFKAGDENGRR